jgi:F0F1-type ATP synthase delta subunit
MSDSQQVDRIKKALGDIKIETLKDFLTNEQLSTQTKKSVIQKALEQETVYDYLNNLLQISQVNLGDLVFFF